MAKRTRKTSRVAGLSARRRRSILALLFVMLALAAIFGIYGWLSLTRLLAPYKPDSTRHILVTVPLGTTSRHLALLLTDKGVVRSPFAFLLALKLSGEKGPIRAARYDLSPAMSPRQIVAALQSGAAARADWTTIPEGFTIRQVAERLGSKHLADPAAFVSIASTQGQMFGTSSGFSPPGKNLEGYLFPDTYFIPAGSTIPAILRQMVEEFDSKVVDTHPQVTDWRKTMILASLIEREAKVDKDRPLIASVIINRLRIGMPLDIDASIEYALPKHKARLMDSDLKVPSPYNTYLHKGLPPGPICNPGLPSIEAAIHPARTDYLYYVAGPGGAHIFSHTLAEQDKAIAHLRNKKAS